MRAIQNPYTLIQYRTTSKQPEIKQLTIFKLYITSIHNIILGLVCNKFSVEQSQKLLTRVADNVIMSGQ